MARITLDFDNTEKINIIAITGKVGSGTWEIYSWLRKKLPVDALQEVKAGDNCTVDLFLQKILNGDIVEATQGRDGAIWGIDVSGLSPRKVYLTVLAPERISRLLESDRVQVLPIYCSMPAAARIPYLINPDMSDSAVNRYINDYLESEKAFDDVEEYLDEDITFFAHFKNHTELSESLYNGQFVDSLREWAISNDIFTNLDNFI